MMTRIVECVPNFSEGRDRSIIEEITAPIHNIPGVTLLDIDMGADFNRTVVTMVGDPDSVLKAAIDCSLIAGKLIDMQSHTGEHARMGAIDVVPFIPITGVSIEECIILSKRYAEAVSNTLKLPIFLYAEAARSEQRVRLPDIRRGEYEGLKEKLESDDWAPDFGPSNFNPKLGATATGARQILIAYNVNLNTDDKSKANKIASIIRTTGSLVRDQDGQKIIGDDGKPLRKPGKFDALQAAGWMYDDSTAQVSMNLLNHNITGLHQVTETIRDEAEKIGLCAVAGELVGLVPLEAIISSGKHYHVSPESANELELVDAAINGLMLNALGDFDPHSNIIEWAIMEAME